MELGERSAYTVIPFDRTYWEKENQTFTECLHPTAPDTTSSTRRRRQASR